MVRKTNISVIITPMLKDRNGYFKKLKQNPSMNNRRVKLGALTDLDLYLLFMPNVGLSEYTLVVYALRWLIWIYSTAHAENASSASHRGQISTRTNILVREGGWNSTHHRDLFLCPSRTQQDNPRGLIKPIIVELRWNHRGIAVIFF